MGCWVGGLRAGVELSSGVVCGNITSVNFVTGLVGVCQTLGSCELLFYAWSWSLYDTPLA